jgi:hypothetical protein
MEVIYYIVTILSDYRPGFGMKTELIDHIKTRLVTTLNYSAIANFHTLQITRTMQNPFILFSLVVSR